MRIGTKVNPLEFEHDLWSREFTLVAGVDEAGRGPLAGPVVAAVVRLIELEYRHQKSTDRDD